jgi:hypothetical protein
MYKEGIRWRILHVGREDKVEKGRHVWRRDKVEKGRHL